MNYKEINNIPRNIIGIYKIENLINNKIYIGQSVDIRERLYKHIWNSISSKDSRYNSPLYSAIRKYGKENFDFSILEILDIEKDKSKERLNEREIYFIDKFNSYRDGYNLTEGGNSTLNSYGEKNSKAKLTEKEVYNIRERYKNLENIRDAYEDYKNKISFSQFEDIFYGCSWKNTHYDVYTKENKEKRKKVDKKNNKSLTDEQALKIINLLENSELSLRKIGKIFNVSEDIIGGINRCITYKRLHNYKKNIRKEVTLQNNKNII